MFFPPFPDFMGSALQSIPIHPNPSQAIPIHPTPLLNLPYLLNLPQKRHDFRQKSGTLGKLLREFWKLLREFRAKLTEYFPKLPYYFPKLAAVQPDLQSGWSEYKNLQFD